MTTFHEELAPLVERAASATAAKWPSYVSAEDVAQEIWIWVYGSGLKSLESALKGDDWEAKVYSTMLKVASSAASTEDQQANGYSKDDTYVYSVKVIESLLESVFTYEDWQSFGLFGDGQPSSKGQVNETGDVYAMLCDVRAGLAELKEDQREILFRKFYLPGTHEEKAEEMGITRKAFGNRATRALGALREKLGRVSLADLRSGWDDRREAMTNGHANALTERQYEG